MAWPSVVTLRPRVAFHCLSGRCVVARIRSIKPEFWKSEAVTCHDFFTRLVFIGLWTYVDDNGVGLDHWRLIAAELFPLEEDFARVSREVRESLARLADTGRIVRYTVDGKSYFAVSNWSEHQRIDRPGKARYPEPDDPRSTPTPPAARANAESSPAEAKSFATPSRDSRETPATGEGEKGNRGEGEKVNYPALAALDAEAPAAEPITGEVIQPALGELFVVTGPAGTDLAPAEHTNAGQLTRQWIDFCNAKGVKLTNTAIKRYGKHIKDALNQQFSAEHIKHALAGMLNDRVASRPALLDNYLIRVQQGPEMPPERLSRHQADAERRSPEGVTAAARLYDTLTRPA